MVSLGLAMMKGKEMADEQYKREAERAEWHRDAGLRAKRSKAEEAKLDDELSPERQKMLEMARQMEFKVSQNMQILDKHRGRMETDPTAFADALNETHPQADGSKWVVDDKDGYTNGLTLKRVAPDGTVLQDSGKMFSNVTSGEHALMALQGAVQKPLEQIKDIAGRRTAAEERNYKAWEKKGDWAAKLEEAQYNMRGKLAEAQVQAASQRYMADLLHQTNLMGRMPDVMRSFVDTALGRQGIQRGQDGKYYSGGAPIADNDPRVGIAFGDAQVMAQNWGAQIAGKGNPMLAYFGTGKGTAGVPATTGVPGFGFDPTAGFKPGVNVDMGYGLQDSLLPGLGAEYTPDEAALMNSLFPAAKGVSQYNPYTGVPTAGRQDYTPRPMMDMLAPPQGTPNTSLGTLVESRN